MAECIEYIEYVSSLSYIGVGVNCMSSVCSMLRSR